MPNHVRNHIFFDCGAKRLKEILTSVKYDNDGENEDYGVATIDFNKIIPMPEALNIEAGSHTERGLNAYRDFIEIYTHGGTLHTDALMHIPSESEQAFLRNRKDIRADEWQLGKTAWLNLLNYGAPTWYEWRNEHWGTKWNSYGYGYEASIASDGKRYLSFETAWSAPCPILRKLSEMYPDVAIIHEWADEDIGHNCGRVKYLAGKVSEEYIPENQREAYELAAEVWHHDLSEYGLALNANGTEYISLDDETYELIELFGRPMLFANGRLTEKDIPNGLYSYDLRQSDDGDDRFSTIEPHVAVNHGGTVVTDQPIDFGEAGYIQLAEETAPDFTGCELTFDEYMRRVSEHKEGMKLD